MLILLSLDVKPSLKANTLAEMMASFGSCGLAGVLYYCLLPLKKKKPCVTALRAQQRLDHTVSAAQEMGEMLKSKVWGLGGAVGKQLLGLMFLLSSFVFCSASWIYYFQYCSCFHSLVCAGVQQSKFESIHILRQYKYGWGFCFLPLSFLLLKTDFFPEKYVQITIRKRWKMIEMMSW